MILSIQNVVKRYENHTAVDHVSFDVPKGGVFGLLGPNGAGKTSLIRMITTITMPDEGRILLNGAPLDARTPEKIGYMPEERGLYKKMKVGDQLLYLARLKGLSEQQARAEIAQWLTRLDIKDWAQKKIEDLSKGMQQKIQFIATVLHRPPLIILDEPFSGLDPINANLIKDEIARLNAEGASVIFSTHRMEQVEEMCDHIVLINKGKNVLFGEVKAIKNQYKQNQYLVETADDFPRSMPDQFAMKSMEGNRAIFQLTDESQGNDLLRQVLQTGARVIRFEELLPTFNEIFIRTVENNA